MLAAVEPSSAATSPRQFTSLSACCRSGMSQGASRPTLVGIGAPALYTSVTLKAFAFSKVQLNVLGADLSQSVTDGRPAALFMTQFCPDLPAAPLYGPMKFFSDFEICIASGEEYLTFSVATIQHTGTYPCCCWH